MVCLMGCYTFDESSGKDIVVEPQDIEQESTHKADPYPQERNSVFS